jgi:phenylpyruvate tautomerase PptA (4-oxalocrotonate tautomerase family)
MPIAVRMRWTERQLMEENSADFISELSREIIRQNRTKEKLG